MLLVICVVVVFLVIFTVPVFVYGLANRFAGLSMPDEQSPMRFLAGIAVSKFGTAIAFVFLFDAGADIFRGIWLTYAGLWWLMFVFGEIGQAMGSAYSLKEAVAGVISESIYFPAAAFLLHALLTT